MPQMQEMTRSGERTKCPTSNNTESRSLRLEMGCSGSFAVQRQLVAVVAHDWS